METSIKFIYDFPYVKQIIGYLLIPFLIFIILCSIILLIYSAKHKDHKDPIYQYRINLASLIVSILLVLVFLSILVGFALALKQQVAQMEGKYVVSYVVFGAPIVPVIAIFILFIKLIKLIRNKPSKEETIDSEVSENISVAVEDQNQVQIQIQEVPKIELEEEKEDVEIL